MIKKIGKKYQVDISNGRHGKRIKKMCDTHMEAKAFEKFVLAKRHNEKEWMPEKDDNRLFDELIKDWYENFGQYLKDGERRYDCLLSICEYINNPIARKITAKDFLKYRSIKKEEGRSDKTINNHLGYVNAVFNKLIKTGAIKFDNPFKTIDMIKVDETELSYLTVEQIDELLNCIEENSFNKHVLLLTKIGLSTGGRWSELENITLRNIRNYQIDFNMTKSGKSRSVPITETLSNEITEHLKEHGEFTGSIGAFRRALAKTSIKLPKGQASHVLRHSFASHFMINGGNIITLQKILGHSTILMTMRYAHLAPDHLVEARNLNALSTWEESRKI